MPPLAPSAPIRAVLLAALLCGLALGAAYALEGFALGAAEIDAAEIDAAKIGVVDRTWRDAERIRADRARARAAVLEEPLRTEVLELIEEGIDLTPLFVGVEE